nr:MAG TPA: hypothetical protein [Caudoviricetes sp.]
MVRVIAYSFLMYSVLQHLYLNYKEKRKYLQEK